MKMNVNRNMTSLQDRKEKKSTTAIPKHIITSFKTTSDGDGILNSVSSKIPIVSPDRTSGATKSINSTLRSIATNTLEHDHHVARAITPTSQTNPLASWTSSPSKADRYRPPRPPGMTKKDNMEKNQLSSSTSLLLSPSSPGAKGLSKSDKSDNAINNSKNPNMNANTLQSLNASHVIPIPMTECYRDCKNDDDSSCNKDDDNDGFSSSAKFDDDNDDNGGDEGSYFSKQGMTSPPTQQTSRSSLSSHRPRLLPRVVGCGIGSNNVNINRNLQLPCLNSQQEFSLVGYESDWSLSSSSSEEDYSNYERTGARVRAVQKKQHAVFRIPSDANSGEDDFSSKEQSSSKSNSKPPELLSFSGSSDESHNRRRQNKATSSSKQQTLDQRDLPGNKSCNNMQKNQTTLIQSDSERKKHFCHQSDSTIAQESNSSDIPSSNCYGTTYTTTTNNEFSPDRLSKIFLEKATIVSISSKDSKSISSLLSHSGGSSVFNYSEDESF